MSIQSKRKHRIRLKQYIMQFHTNTICVRRKELVEKRSVMDFLQYMMAEWNWQERDLDRFFEKPWKYRRPLSDFFVTGSVSGVKNGEQNSDTMNHLFEGDNQDGHSF